MMTKTFCHNGYCKPIYKENGEDHSKMTSVETFINIVVIVFIITFVAAVIGGALVEFFTL